MRTPRNRRATAIALAALAAALALVLPGAARSVPQDDDLVVGFTASASPAEREQALRRLRLVVVRAVPPLDLVRVRRTGAALNPATELTDPAIASVAPLGRFQQASVPAPDDPAFAKQWNLPLIQIPDAWEVSKGKGATVALLDTGVAFEDFDTFERAPDLAGTTFVPGHDFVDGDEHPNDDLNPQASDRPGHGTHSASIIAATTGNGLGSAGVAPEAALMPVRVLDTSGSGTDDQIAAGIVFAADHGAQVVNMSFDSPQDRPMTKAAVAYAASKGVTLIAAVGNTGRPPVGFPAAYPEVIAVGAVRLDKAHASYSSYGAAGDVDLVAPGGDISVDENRDGEPDGILSHSMVYSKTTFGEPTVQGTSAAAPHVSGVAALLVASGLATSPADVRKALVSSALDVGAPGSDARTGAGLVQARAALTAAGAAPPATTVPPTSAPPLDPPGPGPRPTPSGSAWPALAGAGALLLLVVGGRTAIQRRRRP
jgi:serine protease